MRLLRYNAAKPKGTLDLALNMYLGIGGVFTPAGRAGGGAGGGAGIAGEPATYPGCARPRRLLTFALMHSAHNGKSEKRGLPTPRAERGEKKKYIIFFWGFRDAT